MRPRLQRILCTTDFSTFAGRSLPYGIALAREFGSTLYGCHVVDLPAAAVYGEPAVLAYGAAYIDPLAQRERVVKAAHEQLKALLADSGVATEILVAAGQPAEEITRLAADRKVDLVIAATHGRSGLRRLLLGSVTARLMQTLPCPLLIVKSPSPESSAAPPAAFRLKRILVGCDFSPNAALAFENALSLAQEFEAELHLVHVIEPPIYKDLQAFPAAADGELFQSLHERLKKRLDRMLPEEACNWCAPQIALLEGLPDEEITRYALRRQVDLIVLGTRGQGVMEKIFVGSTTERVARRAPCPVLSVCPKTRLG
jgi:nucleotide-binding universal stress UspA family protein